jgi:two-component system, chemotaxis family, chemotaxis protein CheY
MSVDMNMNILIVDDYKTMLRLLSNMLKQLGFKNIEEAVDGREALSKLRDGNYELVISDLDTNPMNSLQLLKEVRADAKLKLLHFIMVTVDPRLEYVNAAKNAGVSNYIIKPFNAKTLKQKIASVIGEF